MSREEIIGDCRLILGDCREILPTLGKVDAVVTDPPYGQSYVHSGGGRPVSNAPLSRAYKRSSVAVIGDEQEFDPTPILLAAHEVIMWGAHRFHHRLPPGTWLVWDKVPTGKERAQGDGEAAWKNDTPPRAMRIIRHLWDGVCVDNRADLVDGRVHPMQKPIDVMAWCVAMTAGDVLDPFMGSGTTGVACVNLGRRFIGIEIEEKYFSIACRRIEEATRQPRLFAEPRPKPKQEALL